MRKVTVHEENFGKHEGLPRLIPANFHLLCSRCNERLGAHLGYRCVDDKGNFAAAIPSQTRSAGKGSK